MLGDLRVDDFFAVSLELSERPCLVGTHEAAVTDDVGGEDGGELPGDVFGFHGCLPDETIMRPLDYRNATRAKTA